MAQDGEVFLLDRGEPVRIMYLAQRMIDLFGMTLCDEVNTDGDIEIEVTGLRPGEKFYEELLIGNKPIDTEHPQIMKTKKPIMARDTLLDQLEILRSHIAHNDAVAIRALLSKLVPDFIDRGSPAVAR